MDKIEIDLKEYQALTRVVEAAKNIKPNLSVSFDEKMRPFYAVAYQPHFSQSIIKLEEALASLPKSNGEAK